MYNMRNASRYLAALVVTASIVLAGCSGKTQTAQSSSVFDTARSNGPAASAVRGLDARAALEVADSWGPTTKGVTTFIDQTKVSFSFDNGDKVEIPLPEKEMVVAIAPYINRTHPCEIHYMSGCQGELVNVPVEVHATNSDGTVLVDETLTTMDNGFIELWLPRDRTIGLTLTAQGKSTTGTITTNADSNTCITTFQLM